MSLPGLTVKDTQACCLGVGGEHSGSRIRLGGLGGRLQGERKNHCGGGKDNWGLGTSVGEGEDNCGEQRSLGGRDHYREWG